MKNWVVVFLFVGLYLLSSVDSNTVIATICSDGMILAADSLSSVSALISTRSTRQVHFLTQNIVLLSKDSNNIQFVRFYDDLKDEIHRQRMWAGKHLEVEAIAQLARRMIQGRFSNKLHVLIAGPEAKTTREDENRAKLFEIFPCGALFPCSEFAVSGSGSDLATSILVDFFKDGNNLSISPTVESTLPVVSAALSTAMKLNPFSGGKSPSMWVFKDSTWKKLAVRSRR